MIEVEILGIRFLAGSFDDAINRMVDAARDGPPQRVHFANVHTTVEAHRDPRLRSVFDTADFICTDGVPLVWLARRRGEPRAERVSGPDAMLAICDRGRSHGLRHYFFGGGPGVAARLAERLATIYPGLLIAGTDAPPIRAAGALEDPATIETINRSEPDVVWIGLGAPKQELWAAEHASSLTARLVLPVGAAFDFNSGRVRRAPRWMRRSGLEWLFRLLAEPRRLAGRYLKSNLAFAWLLLTEPRSRPSAR